MQTRLTKKIYRHSPIFLQNIFTSIYGWDKNRKRYRNSFGQWQNFFRDAHGWTHDQLVEFQNERIRALAKTAFENVPFYHMRFQENHLTPADIQSVKDLQKLPILEKQEVRTAGELLVNRDIRRRALYHRATSGSTGSPLLIRSAWSTMEMEFGFVWSRFRPGVQRGEPWALFSGLDIVEASRSKPPFWRTNRAANERLYSIFHMNEKTLPYYVDDLNSRKISYFAGYPSALYIIAEFMDSHHIQFENSVKAFFSSSETLQPQHKHTIERVFGCKVWNRYGQGELVASITQYPCGHLHYDMDYGVIEFLPIGRENGLIKAEIIATGLHDTSWPLLRYRTGDVCLYDPAETCDHVAGQVIREIWGRTGQYFTLPDGSRIINCTSIVRTCRNIRNVQVVQCHPGSIQVRVVPGARFSQQDKMQVLRQFRNRLGRDITITIQCVDQIEKSKNGKYLSIVNQTQDNTSTDNSFQETNHATSSATSPHRAD